MPPKSTGKRKSDGAGLEASSSKKTRVDDAAVQLMTTILANPNNYPISDDDDEIRNSLLTLAQHAQTLQQQLNSLVASGSSAVAPKKTNEELEVGAEKIHLMYTDHPASKVWET
ncbi:hypothetical protein PHLCEN_2v12950, partial [Hermanssonia centrifuga]